MPRRVCVLRRDAADDARLRRGCVCAVTGGRERLPVQSLVEPNGCVFGHWRLRTSANCDEAQACFDRRSCERSGGASRECVCSHRWTGMIVCPVTRVYGRSRIVSRRLCVSTGGVASEAGLRRGSLCSVTRIREGLWCCACACPRKRSAGLLRHLTPSCQPRRWQPSRARRAWAGDHRGNGRAAASSMWKERAADGGGRALPA